MWFKRKKKTKPKKDDKVKVFWHKEPVSFAHHDDDDDEEEVGDGTTTTATETNLTRSSGNTTTFSELSRTTTTPSSFNNNTNNNNKSCIVSGMNLLHHNTELSLLSHVRNNVQQWDDTKHDTARSDVLHSIDTYCISRQWMMHCGPNKGDILIKALRSSMLYKRALLSTSWDYTRNINDSSASSSISSSINNNDNNTRGQFIAVELGTYCGYASILMGRLMHQIRNATMDCHLFTTEINPEYKQIATEMISMSGLDDIISVHQVRSCTTRSSSTTNNGYHNTNNYYDDTNTDIVDVIWSAIEEYNTNNNNHKHHHHHQKHQQPKIDFLFIDHNKESYKSDLQKLELSGMICRGTKVVADDALFVDIEDYVLYIQQRRDDGIVKTRTVPCKAVEYCGDDIIDMADYQDGVEITDYLQDPP